MKDEDDEDEGGKGCAALLLIVAPGTAGTWLLYGPALGLLSVPLWVLMAHFMLKIK